MLIALDRAVAIAQVRNTASGIDEELNLNVARTRHEPLEEQSPVAERARCLRSTSLKGFVALLDVLDMPNSLTPAATDGFQDSACTGRDATKRHPRCFASLHNGA